MFFLCWAFTIRNFVTAAVVGREIFFFFIYFIYLFIHFCGGRGIPVQNNLLILKEKQGTISISPP